MYRYTLASLLLLLLICGCSTAPASNEPPSCGPSVADESVTVVDARHLYSEQGLVAILDYAVDKAGSFRLISDQTFRADTRPHIAGKSRWVGAQKAAASKGCDILILVDSKMRRASSGGIVDRAGNRKLHMYFLMGVRAP